MNKIIYLKITNLLSHKETVFAPEWGKAVLLHGENKDNKGQKSNGAGKSALIEGFSLAIAGKAFRDALPSDLIMDGKDSCQVELKIKNFFTKKTLLVKRKFFKKKSQSSEFKVEISGEYEKDVDQKHKIADSKEVTPFIANFLGISE